MSGPKDKTQIDVETPESLHDPEDSPSEHNVNTTVPDPSGDGVNSDSSNEEAA